MRIEFIDGKFELELTREELVIAISALGWTDSLVPSDEAFEEFVGCPRDKYRSLIDELADKCRANPG